MKKIIFFVGLAIFSLSVSSGFAINVDPKLNSDNTAVPVKQENRLSENEISRITKRVEEINGLDKSSLTFKEKSELRKELRTINKEVRRGPNTVYIGTGTLILIIILVIILL